MRLQLTVPDLPCFNLNFFSLYMNYIVGSFNFIEALNITYAYYNQLPFSKLIIESYGGYLIQQLKKLSKSHFEQPTAPQLFKKPPEFYGTRRSVTTFNASQPMSVC